MQGGSINHLRDGIAIFLGYIAGATIHDSTLTWPWTLLACLAAGLAIGAVLAAWDWNSNRRTPKVYRLN